MYMLYLIKKNTTYHYIKQYHNSTIPNEGCFQDCKYMYANNI